MAMGLHTSSRGRGRRRAPMAEINVTPFVDVMLVLLIIFLVTAPLLASGVPVELPARLDAIARANEGEDRPRQIMLRADKGLDYGRVMRVMGELNRAGLTRISLVTTGSEGAAESAPAAVTNGSETGT